jgi:membrane-associated phospholipid phosphatase
MADHVGDSEGSLWKIRPGWFVRVLVVAAGLGLWFLTQSLIGSRALATAEDVGGATLARNDGLFRLTTPINEFLHGHPAWADGLLIFSSAVIDVLGIGMIVISIFGPTMRPFVGLLMVFGLRQLMQVLCVLPTPEGMIWRYPGFPSLLVTYGVANDFFFSGHTAIAVFGATQLARIPRRGMLVLAVAVAALEIFTVIVLRAHYTMDVFAGAVAALWVAHVADRVAPAVDQVLARCCAPRPAASA